MMSFLKGAIEIAPSIFVFNDVIKNTEEIIKTSLKKAENGEMYEAVIRSDDDVFSGDLVVEKNIRDTLIVNLPPSFSEDVSLWLLSQKIWQYGNEYAKYHDVAFSNMEHPQFLLYPRGRGFYKSHVDSHPNSPRIFSAVLYLNEVEVGGETYFEKFDVSINPEPGKMILFPANFVYRHGSNIPLSGDKYCIVTWFNP
jgi:hypothetical protein